MRSGPLWRVSVETTAEAEEALAQRLEVIFGQTPSFYFDAETGEVTATVFLQKAPQRARLKGDLKQAFEHLAACGLAPGSGRLSITRVRPQDWSESWKRHFKPFTVGSGLLVKPSWSRRKPARGQKVIVIDPGLSFGTGQHPTTRFCLEQIANRNREARQSFLDVGTGSGILAIAAAKLGYSPVRGFDFDPAAVRVARENVRKNRVAVRVARADIMKTPTGLTKYDVVCANLTADLLEGCGGKLKGFLKPGGLLVLAGILHTQADSVRQSFEKRGFCLKARCPEGEWESLALRLERP